MSFVGLLFFQSPHTNFSFELIEKTADDLAGIIVGGIDRDGTGAVYSFDPVGSYERESCRAAGAAQELVQPFLDALVGFSLSFPFSVNIRSVLMIACLFLALTYYVLVYCRSMARIKCSNPASQPIYLDRDQTYH